MTQPEPTPLHPTMSLPVVRGICPACGAKSLFLGNGGYVTCGIIRCPQPDAASTVLERPAVLASPDDRTYAPGTFGPHVRPEKPLPVHVLEVRHGAPLRDRTSRLWGLGRDCRRKLRLRAAPTPATGDVEQDTLPGT